MKPTLRIIEGKGPVEPGPDDYYRGWSEAELYAEGLRLGIPPATMARLRRERREHRRLRVVESETTP